MILRGVGFNSVFCASGALNFFGEGWWWHRFLRPFGLNFGGATLVTKTTTLAPHQGNLPLREDLQPVEWFPKCIYANYLKGYVVNRVGLSTPGLLSLLNRNHWQQLTSPFVISLSSVADASEERLDEFVTMFGILSQYCCTERFRAPFGLELNYSCPNVKERKVVDWDDWRVEIEQVAAVAGHYLPDCPVILKTNILTPQVVLQRACISPYIDAVHISNTVPWRAEVGGLIDWDSIERDLRAHAPKLLALGGGGLSGAPILPLVNSYISATQHRVPLGKPIIGGGGILTEDDGYELVLSGASALSLGSVAILRSWRVRRLVRSFSICAIPVDYERRGFNSASEISSHKPIIGFTDDAGDIWVEEGL